VSYFQLIAQGDAVSRLVALLLLGMSVASWVVILWKVWLLPRARTDVARRALPRSGNRRRWAMRGSACPHLTGRRWSCR
jgi:biopolymer transport protein ExbB/TolQ